MTQGLNIQESIIYDYFSDNQKKDDFIISVNNATSEYHKKGYTNAGKIIAEILKSIFCLDSNCVGEGSMIDPKIKFFLTGITQESHLSDL